MPTMTIIIIAVLAPLLIWTLYSQIRDLVRKLSKGADIRGRDEEIRTSIEAERELDRQRMGSMFGASLLRGRGSNDGDKS